MRAPLRRGTLILDLCPFRPAWGSIFRCMSAAAGRRGKRSTRAPAGRHGSPCILEARSRARWRRQNGCLPFLRILCVQLPDAIEGIERPDACLLVLCAAALHIYTPSPVLLLLSGQQTRLTSSSSTKALAPRLHPHRPASQPVIK